MSSGIGAVIDSELAMSHEVDGDFGHDWLSTNSAGSGAYALVEWRPNDVVVLRHNPDFWRGAPEMETVIFRHVPEPASQRLLLEGGDVDMARNLTADQVAALEGADGIRIENYPKGNVFYLGMNQDFDPFSDPLVNEAMRWLVDYDGMAASFLAGQYQVHQSFWAAGFDAALTETPFVLDPARARALLADAGYPEGFSVQLDCASGQPWREMCQSIEATMEEAGLDVDIAFGTPLEVVTRYRARDHELVALWSSPGYIDPHEMFQYFVFNPDNGDDSTNQTLAWRNRWDNPDLTERVAAAIREVDFDVRREMYLQIQREMQAFSPYVMMFQSTEQVAMRDGIEGFVSGPGFDTVYYWDVTKSADW